MSIFIKELIANKLKQLTPDEIIHYGKMYGFSLSKQEADQIVQYVKKHPLDPFSAADREKMLRELARITNKSTAKKAHKLFLQIIQSYGLDSLFTETQ